jgi:hypothetical protein
VESDAGAVPLTCGPGCTGLVASDRARGWPREQGAFLGKPNQAFRVPMPKPNPRAMSVKVTTSPKEKVYFLSERIQPKTPSKLAQACSLGRGVKSTSPLKKESIALRKCLTFAKIYSLRSEINVSFLRKFYRSINNHQQSDNYKH